MPCGGGKAPTYVRDAHSSVHANASLYFFVAIPIVSNVGN